MFNCIILCCLIEYFIYYVIINLVLQRNIDLEVSWIFYCPILGFLFLSNGNSEQGISLDAGTNSLMGINPSWQLEYYDEAHDQIQCNTRKGQRSDKCSVEVQPGSTLEIHTLKSYFTDTINKGKFQL